jgi:L-2,4-diaminobutyrate decarboxylase
MEPECNIVCFRVVKSGVSDLNAFNLELRQRALEKGNFYLVQTTLRGVVYLRVSLMNPLTTEKELEMLLDELESFSIN